MGLLTEDTKAIILLCGILGKRASVKPLSQTEYTRLVHWLIERNLRPASLLDGTFIQDAASNTKLDENRLYSLLARGTQLGFAVENWQRNGIWVISRSDSEYPTRYKKHLKDKAPPLLFGVGERSLLTGGGLAMVGSRNVDGQGEIFTRKVAKQCVHSNMPVISGGARGVDQISMETTLDNGGASIGVLADNLLKKSIGKKFRTAIANRRLLLISPYHPEARFQAWAAMGRNKLIYAMADFALVVSSDHEKGGTWAGATEEMKREYSVPVFTRIDKTIPKGNKKLFDFGAVQWPEIISSHNMISILRSETEKIVKKQRQKNATLFDQAIKDINHEVEKKDLNIEKSDRKIIETKEKSSVYLTIYDAVLPIILEKLSSPTSPATLAETVNVQKTQLSVWLKKALEEGRIKKLNRPIRYIRL